MFCTLTWPSAAQETMTRSDEPGIARAWNTLPRWPESYASRCVPASPCVDVSCSVVQLDSYAVGNRLMCWEVSFQRQDAFSYEEPDAQELKAYMAA